MQNPYWTPYASIGRIADDVPTKSQGIVHIAIAASANGYEDITYVPSFPSDWTKSGTVEEDHQSSMLYNTDVAM